MAHATPNSLQASLGKLQLSTTSKAASKIPKSEPADSWEDEADEDDDASLDEPDGVTTPVLSNPPPSPPPPTPSSPFMRNPDHSLHQVIPPYGLDGALESLHSTGPRVSPNRKSVDGEERRPDKSTAVASRLIAAGIGQKAPKRTKEQREYDQALKVQEKKKRDQAREEEDRKRREKEQALKDVWGD